MKIEKSLDGPEIIESRGLSKKIGKGIKVDVMDFSQTRTKSHKGIKARHGLDYVNKKNGDYALIITSGNAGPGFDIVSRNYDIQVVKFVNPNIMRKPINITELGAGRDCKNRYGITIRLPNGWFGSKKLEKFWKKLVLGKKKKYKNNPEFDKLIEIVYGSRLNPFNAFDVTNIIDYNKKGKSPYLIPEIQEAVKEHNYCFVPYGSGELFTGFQEASSKLWFGKPVLVAVTSNGNPLSWNKLQRPSTKYRKSHADKLDTAKMGAEHLKTIAMSDKRTYFCSLNDKLIDKANGSMNLVKKERKNLTTTSTGSIGLGVLNKENVKYSNEGIEVKGTYRFNKQEINFYERLLRKEPLIIKPGSKILIVNTGGLS